VRRGLILILMLIVVIVIGYYTFLNREIISDLNVSGPFSGMVTQSLTGESTTIGDRLKMIKNNIKHDFTRTVNYFWSRDFQFQNISFISADAENNLYLIDQSQERVVKLNTNNQVERIISTGDIKKLFGGGIKYSNNVCLAAEVVADNIGDFYVLYRILDDYGNYVKKEVIIKYHSKNGQQSVFYQVDYGTASIPRSGRLRGLQIYKDDICFFDLTNNDGNDVVLYKINKTNNLNIVSDIKFSLPKSIRILDITGTEWESIRYSTINGEIFTVSSPAQKELHYPVNDGQVTSFPWFLVNQSSSQMFYIDLYKNGIYKLSGDGSESTLMFSDKDSTGARIVKFKNIFASPNGVVVSSAIVSGITEEENCSGIIIIHPDGKKVFMEKAEISVQELLFRWLIWAMLFIAVIFLVYILKVLYVEWMHKKVPLFIKQLIVFVPLFIIALAVTTVMVFNFSSYRYTENDNKQAMMLTNIFYNVINGDVLNKINQPSQYMQEDYLELRSQTQKLFLQNNSQQAKASNKGQYYFVIYKVLNNNIYAVMDDEDGVFFTPLEATEKERQQYMDVYFNDTFERNNSSDSEGTWSYILGPIKDSSGKIAGIFEVGMDTSGIQAREDAMRQRILGVMFIIILLMALVVVAMSYLMTRHLGILRDSVREMTAGNWDVVVSVKSSDEVADLCDGFNDMAQHVRDYISQITKISESYYRFAPKEFLKYLGKESILDVRLGDQVEKTMSVMFSYIRSFPAISEQMTPEENFNFINQYLKYVGPAIRENNGLIDKYMGSGIMALFDDSPEYAVKAAIDMRKNLNRFNELRASNGQSAIEIGTGLHTGPLMLGIIGEKERMEGTVISDNVNLAALLQRITEKLGARILVTEDLMRQMPNRKKYKYRKLGLVKVEGKKEPVQIYDIFEGSSDLEQKLKEKTKKDFEQGIEYYQAGRFYDARTKFVEVIRENRLDEAAKKYFLLCDEYSRHGSPEGWDGTLEAGKI
jgi:adenylate cyclase